MKNAPNILRIFSAIVIVLTGLLLFNPRDGRRHALVWIPKLVIAGCSPLLVLLGGISTLLGFIRKAPLAVGAGMFSTAVATKHIISVTAARAAFEEVFGLDWENRVPAGIRANFAPRRWQPVIAKPAPGPLHYDVAYGINPSTGRPLLADVLQPPDGVPRTGLAMVYIHGGAWIYGRKNIHKLPVFRRLALQGHVVVDIDYIKAPHTSVTEMVVDVKQAILWLKQNSATYNINPERVVLVGQSAGAQMALLSAYTPNAPAFQAAGMEGDTSVRAVVSSYGPTDMFALHDDIDTRFGRLSASRLGRNVQYVLQKIGQNGDVLSRGVSGVVGSTPAENPDIYRLLSPVSYISPACPPTLFLQGTHDIFIDHREVEKMHVKLRQMGVPAVYMSFDNCDHAFDTVLPRVSPSSQTVSYYFERFLALMV